MRNPSKQILASLLLLAAVQSVSAFSLLGPVDGAFQVAAIGYNLPGDIGGPMNIKEEYRWNIPVITYAFDESFVSYFGSNGVYAVEQAIKILNDLPTASRITNGLPGDPNIYINGQPVPLETRGDNFAAQALNLVDLKSFTLTLLLEQMGLAEPERWTFCLRARFIGTGGAPTNYSVIKRNIDPITGTYSSFVNGTLFTYRIFDTTGQPNGFADAEEVRVDQTASEFTSVADGFLGLGFGQYFSGLTRDDVGGLRYLLRNNNFHGENLLPNTTLASLNISPWGVPDFGTNAALTNVVVANAIRPGIEKISFQRVNFDSLLGETLNVTNVYVDTYVTNGVVTNQIVQRIITVPDVLFTAADLGVVFYFPVLSSRTTTALWANNSATLNGQVAGGGPTAGPGVIQPQAQLSYSKVGPYFINQFPFFMNEATAARGIIWGSFDGTVNPPIVYPDGTTIQDIERQVVGTP
jgi:hypothetical protein